MTAIKEHAIKLINGLPNEKIYYLVNIINALDTGNPDINEALKEQKIPLNNTADPFYSDENMERLKRAIADAEAGRNMTEHDLIEVED